MVEERAASFAKRQARGPQDEQKLRVGVIWATTYNKFDPASPFGGCKESSFVREGGLHSLAAYCRLG